MEKIHVRTKDLQLPEASDLGLEGRSPSGHSEMSFLRGYYYYYLRDLVIIWIIEPEMDIIIMIIVKSME